MNQAFIDPYLKAFIDPYLKGFGKHYCITKGGNARNQHFLLIDSAFNGLKGGNLICVTLTFSTLNTLDSAS